MIILALDPGIGSLGWCVVKQGMVAGMGVRVFSGSSDGRKRAGGRSGEASIRARRRGRRKRQRLRALAALLVMHGLLPEIGRFPQHGAPDELMRGAAGTVAPFALGIFLMWLAKRCGRPPRALPPASRNQSEPCGRLSVAPERRLAVQRFANACRAARKAGVMSREAQADVARLLFDAPQSAPGLSNPHAKAIRTAPHKNCTDHELRLLLAAVSRTHGVPGAVMLETFNSRPAKTAATPRETRMQLRKRLWLELPLADCGARLCIYCGLPISLEMLAGDEVEIDHIMPRARGGRGGANLLLCHKTANLEKGGRPPCDVASWREQWPDIMQRAQALPEAKRHRIIHGRPLPAELDAAEIARRGRLMLPLVRMLRATLIELLPGATLLTTAGHEVAETRNRLGLERVLAGGSKTPRLDHRHHAIDAFALAVIAMQAMPQPGWRVPDMARGIEAIATSHAVPANHPAAGGLSMQTAFGPTPFHNGSGRRYGVIRRPVQDLSAAEAAQVRDERLRQVLLRSLAAGRSRQQSENGLPPPGPGTAIAARRVRVLHAMSDPLEIRRDGRTQKLLKPGANAEFCIWCLPDGRWQPEVIRLAATTNARTPHSVPPQKGAFIVMRLRHASIVALGEGQGRTLLRVVKFSADGRLRLAGINDAGDLKARDADRNDPFTYLTCTVERLRRSGARHVRIDVLGRIHDPGPLQMARNTGAAPGRPANDAVVLDAIKAQKSDAS
jgi:5-methylcytosine-specific restriction endonuclease McrA